MVIVSPWDGRRFVEMVPTGMLGKEFVWNVSSAGPAHCPAQLGRE